MTIEITLLGGFAVERDGVPTAADVWGRRQASSLVKLLALAPSRRLHREQVIDALWPDHSLAEAAPKLHKAAHFARRALASADAIVLRDESVALLPNDDVAVDAVSFIADAEAGLRAGDDAVLTRALATCRGELLPDDPYDEWIEPRRAYLRQLRIEVLRRLRRWEELTALDPTDESAHIALMERLMSSGDHHGALRQFERLDRALQSELGVGPGRHAIAMRDQLLQGAAPSTAVDTDELVGRDRERELVQSLFADVDGGRGRTLVLSGPAGVGKTAMLRWIRAAAESRDWRVGQGTAASVEGAWVYAPVLEAIADLCRRQPALLDGLDDNYRVEIDRALAGTDLGWSGEGGHQRLFVAAAELLRVAAADRGVVLVFDDIHDADDASLRLIHYLARCAARERIALVLAHRDHVASPTFTQIHSSLVSRADAIAHELAPLSDLESEALVRSVRPDASAEQAGTILELAAGLPFALVELARRDAHVSWERSAELVVVASVDASTREILQRVAVLGTTFDTDEFVAISDLPDDRAFAHLDRAIAAGLVEHTGSHYRFRHRLVRDVLIRDVAPHRKSRIHRDAAMRLRDLGASPQRVGHHLAEAGDLTAAAPYLLQAADRNAAVGAYRDALDLVERVLAHVDEPSRARALALRADLLFAVGDVSAQYAYRDALAVASASDVRSLVCRYARASVVRGDLESARAALDRAELDGGPADAELLLARGMVAYFSGDIDGAWAIAQQAQGIVASGDKSWQALDLVALEGFLAHSRGEWFDRIRLELQSTRQSPDSAIAIFDGYLCPAEYLLYGPMPYDEVVELARGLRETARRAGALRAVAFAGALAGEAALLAGDLDTAEQELQEAADLHRDIGAASGEAHSLQRLAEVRLARGDRAGAIQLLQRALPMARWSPVSLHLLHRIYGTMILAAPDPHAARAIVDRAETTLGTEDRCGFCSIMLAVPAAIACAAVGDLDNARRHLTIAELSAALWDGTAWQAALHEARASIAHAMGDTIEAERLRGHAAELFDISGQPLDAARCRAS